MFFAKKAEARNKRLNFGYYFDVGFRAAERGEFAVTRLRLEKDAPGSVGNSLL